jgi:NAD-dependent deacetylase
MADASQESDFAAATEALRFAKKVVVLSGAGVSAESGIPTFRASDGLWEGHRIEDVATPAGFKRNPKLVWQFYNGRRENLRHAKPNPGHYALAKLEERFAENFTLVTQNVDGLHQVAGSNNVLEIHGSIRRTRCLGCGEIANKDLEPLADQPECGPCGGRLRPDIVWFHEALPDDIWWIAQVAAGECDVLLVVGTSAVVYPAASLIPIAKQTNSPGATVIECNLTRTEATTLADIGLYGPSGQTLPALLARLGW